MKSAFSYLLIAIITLLTWIGPARALQPDQIALVVNQNIPEGAELAKFYAQARGIPEGRIIELDLPTGDELPFESYQSNVVQPLRQFLQMQDLKDRVRCLVTFYGVPLRIAKRQMTSEQNVELEAVRAELRRVQERIGASVDRLEKLATSLDPNFRPIQPPSADALARRADHASRAANAAIQRVKDPAQRQIAEQQLAQHSRPLTFPVGDPPSTSPTTHPTSAPAAATASTQPLDPTKLAPLLVHQNDPAAREQLRALARRAASPFAYEKVLQEHIILLNPEHTDSALDSELSLLWAEGYPRTGWQPNPLGYPFIGAGAAPPVIMVTRLDAPTAQLVRDIIANSILSERDGLQGSVVIDSRGIPARRPNRAADGFGAFDQRLRDLAELLKQKTRLAIVHDDGPEVLPEESPLTDVALYCGWYSVGKYVPAMQFARGAVAYHVASYELTSLRDPNNTGWCRGLLSDGVVATVGPVSEPLLHAFPVPDDFFPLLLSGELTLAEVYWRTCPLTSWKMSVIGDPLYVPYKSNPALRIDDLPPRLRAIFSDAPATQPGS